MTGILTSTQFLESILAAVFWLTACCMRMRHPLGKLLLTNKRFKKQTVSLVRKHAVTTVAANFQDCPHFQENRVCWFLCLIVCFSSSMGRPRSGELRTQKLKSHLVRSQSLNVLPLKPEIGQNIAMFATLTARNFFLAYFYPSGPFTCILSETSPDFSCVGCG